MALGNTLFGIPLAFWGLGCLAIAFAYWGLWPRPSPRRTQPRTMWQHIVLRYFHSLVWVLLAGACFLAGAGYNIGLWLASAALPVYIVFLVMLVQDRNREQADLAAQRKALQGSAESSSASQADTKHPSGSVSK